VSRCLSVVPALPFYSSKRDRVTLSVIVRRKRKTKELRPRTLPSFLLKLVCCCKGDGHHLWPFLALVRRAEDVLTPVAHYSSWYGCYSEFDLHREGLGNIVSGKPIPVGAWAQGWLS
jgi:hypothetical protein